MPSLMTMVEVEGGWLVECWWGWVLIRTIGVLRLTGFEVAGQGEKNWKEDEFGVLGSILKNTVRLTSLRFVKENQ